MSMLRHRDPSIEAEGGPRDTLVSEISLSASDGHWLEKVQKEMDHLDGRWGVRKKPLLTRCRTT